LDHSSRQAAKLGLNVNPEPVLIAIEGALWGSPWLPWRTAA
jgi:hypothetical protein